MNILKRFNPKPASDPKYQRRQTKRRERHDAKRSLLNETKQQNGKS